MNRKKFIHGIIAAAGVAGLATSCKKRKRIRGSILGASANIGHLLRDKKFTDPVTTIDKDIVIIGGGVSGLSAARALLCEGITDFIVLDLETQAGGNAVSGSNSVSAYPFGAHYVPIPNNSLTEYLQFLTEAGVITGTDEKGLPVYNDYYLCFDPQDRLYINGRWQEGIIPHFGVPDDEKKQIEHFLGLMNEYRYALGKDGKEAFTLPVDNSSKDATLTQLDDITMNEWMIQKGFTSSYLHWYVNYCTRDDFGTPYQQISAWTGIHYFACRKGKGVNAAHGDVLTWPEGNGWLIQQLQKGFEDKILTNSLAVSASSLNDGVLIQYYDVHTHQLKAVNAKQCILAVPQFVGARILNDTKRADAVREHFHYVPWMVANILVNELEERSGAPLSWDNVVYNSPSLGYVEATHQLVNRQLLQRNLTYYLPLTFSDPVSERTKALAKSHEQWVTEIIADLEKIHPNIEEATEEINVMIWGHAMTQPVPHLIHGPVRKSLSESILGRIHFAHTDLAGISIFEEAFYQGLNAAKKVITNLIVKP